MFEPRDKHYLSLQFRDKIYSKKGTEFQTFFENIMRKYYSDFRVIRPYGKEGDRGNDGYRKRAGIYYQVYAPHEPKVKQAKAARKLKEDFYKIKNNWDEISEIKEYYFVFNDNYEGSTQKLEEAITELEKENNNIKFNIFTAKDLEKIFFKLDNADILELGFDIDLAKAVSIAFKFLEKIKIEIDKEYSKAALNMLENNREIVFDLDDDSLKLEYELIESKCFQKIERIDIAKEKYKNITKKFPNDPRAFLYLAEISLQEDKLEEYKELLKIAEKIDSKHWLLKIVKLIRRIHLIEKIDIKEINEEEFPSKKRIKAAFYRLYAILLELSKNKDKSDYFIEKAINLNPNDYKSVIARLSFKVTRILSKEDSDLDKELKRLLKEINKIEEKFHSFGDVGARNMATLNLMKLDLLFKLEDISIFEDITLDTLKLCFNCYFDNHLDQIIARLTKYLRIYDEDFEKLLDYIEEAKKDISDELARSLIFQFNIRNSLLGRGKRFFKKINKQKYIDFIADIENRNDENILKFLNNDKQLAVVIAGTMLNLPELRIKIIENLPNDKEMQKEKLLLLLNYDEENFNEAFSILKNMDISNLHYYEYMQALRIAQEKKAWELEIVIIEKLLEKENNEKNIFSLKSELFHAYYNLEKYSDMINIGEELLEKDLTENNLDEKNKEILLAQTINACFKRGVIDKTNLDKAKVLLEKYPLINPSYEFKISIDAQVYIRNNNPQKALDSIIEGVKIKKKLSSEEYARLYPLVFLQIGESISLKINDLEKIEDNTFVKLKNEDEWYFIGSGNEVDAIKISEGNDNYSLFINKNIGDEIIFKSKYSSKVHKGIIEHIFSTEKYLFWQVNFNFQKLSQSNILSDFQTIEIPKKENGIDTKFLDAFFKDLYGKTKSFFELYCKERLPLATLAISEGGLTNAIGRITRENKGFINFSSGTREELERQKSITKKVVNSKAPFYIDGTSALVLSEMGFLIKILPYLTNLKVSQSVINLLIKTAKKFKPSNGTIGYMYYSHGKTIVSSIEKEQSESIYINFVESIKLLESKPENIVSISQANKIDCFSEQKVPTELNDACILAQKENIPILTEDYLYLKMNEVETKKKAPEYFSSLILLKILNDQKKVSFGEYLDYFGHLSSYRFRFLSLNSDDLEKALLGDRKITNVNIQNIRKFNFSLILSEEYGVSFHSALSVLANFLYKILIDDTIIPDIVEKTFIEIIKNYPMEKYKNILSNMLIEVCVKKIEKDKSIFILTRISDLTKEKIKRLRKAIQIFGSKIYYSKTLLRL